jgi:hypothetical protein
MTLMSAAYQRYLTDSAYDLDSALRDGMTDTEYIEATDPYQDNR